jgi:hypothetical protein
MCDENNNSEFICNEIYEKIDEICLIVSHNWNIIENNEDFMESIQGARYDRMINEYPMISEKIIKNTIFSELLIMMLLIDRINDINEIE